MRGIPGINLDDVACIAALTVAAASIAIAAAAFLSVEAQRGDAAVRQCEQSHSTPPAL